MQQQLSNLELAHYLEPSEIGFADPIMASASVVAYFGVTPPIKDTWRLEIGLNMGGYVQHFITSQNCQCNCCLSPRPPTGNFYLVVSAGETHFSEDPVFAAKHNSAIMCPHCFDRLFNRITYTEVKLQFTYEPEFGFECVTIERK